MVGLYCHYSLSVCVCECVLVSVGVEIDETHANLYYQYEELILKHWVTHATCSLTHASDANLRERHAKEPTPFSRSPTPIIAAHLLSYVLWKNDLFQVLFPLLQLRSKFHTLIENKIGKIM